MESPEFFLAGSCLPGSQQIPPEMTFCEMKNADFFPIEELFDFSNEEKFPAIDVATGNSSAHSSTITVAEIDGSCNSSLCADTRNVTDSQFAADICVPYEALPELEWLSNFVEDSFSSSDFQKLQIVSAIKAEDDPDVAIQYKSSPVVFPNSSLNPAPATIPAKTRSKRSRVAACNWSSRLASLSSTDALAEPVHLVSVPGKVGRRREIIEHPEGRKCLHCATDKTPQWRTGPLGPKTLCNACGVRYKSGRLVPEYRPAASPTFVLTKHSNSHRKVLELRRQKEMQNTQPRFLQQVSGVYDVSAGNEASGEFLIHTGPDFRHLV